MEGGCLTVHKAIRLAWVMVVIVLLSSIGSLDVLLSMGFTCMHQHSTCNTDGLDQGFKDLRNVLRKLALIYSISEYPTRIDLYTANTPDKPYICASHRCVTKQSVGHEDQEKMHRYE